MLAHPLFAGFGGFHRELWIGISLGNGLWRSAFSHNLLVGQFGSGEIAVYDVTSGRFVGKVQDNTGAALTIDGLWALAFGNGGTAGPVNTLFFTAGPVTDYASAKTADTARMKGIIVSGIPGTGMLAFKATLTPEQIDDLVAYLAAFKPAP